METVRFSLISRQDLKIGTGSFEVTLADGKIVQLDEVDIGALLELTPVKTYATSALLPSPSLAGALARVAADAHLYISNGTTWAEIAGTHTHAFSEITSGLVAVANGGSGASFAATAQGSLWYFNGTGTIAALAAGTRGSFLEAKGAAANPVWLGPLTNGQVFVGSTSSDPVAASITGTNGITVTGGAGTIALSGGRKVVRKAADESLDTSVTLQNDDALLFAVAANEIWAFEFVLYVVSTSSTPNLKVGFTVPADAGGIWGIQGKEVGGAWNGIWAGISTSLSVDIAANENTMLLIKGVIANDLTAGNLQLQWAQNTSNATAITVKASSYGVAVLVA